MNSNICSERPQKEPEQPGVGETPDAIRKIPVEQGKLPEKAPERDNTVSLGTGRKQPVLKALRERQAKLKEQEQKKYRAEGAES